MSRKFITPIIRSRGPNVAHDSVTNSYSETEFFTEECKQKVSNVTANSYKPNTVVDLKKRLGAHLIEFIQKLKSSGKNFNETQEKWRKTIMLMKLMPYEIKLKTEASDVAFQNGNTSCEMQREILESCWIEAIERKYEYYLLHYDTRMKKFMDEILTACHLKENNFEEYQYLMDDIFGLVKFDEDEDTDSDTDTDLENLLLS